MNVAYCVSGEIRSLDNWSTHKKYFTDRYNADVFVHTWKWNETTHSDMPFKERNNWTPLVYANDTAIKTINPVSCLIEDRKQITADYCPEVLSVSQFTTFVPRDRVFYMWRSWSLSQFCSTIVKPYDVLIKSRTDIKFNEPLSFDLYKLESNTIYVPYGNDGAGLPPNISLCDWFAFGLSQSMNIYFSLYHKVKEYLIQGVPLHPEIMLLHHLKTHNLKIERIPMNYELTK